MSDPVVVIGGTGGIGSAIVRRLLAGGHTVHVIGHDEAKLQALTDQAGATYAIADVMTAGSLEGAIAVAGPAISGLAYAVGSIKLKLLNKVADDDVQRDFALNAMGAFHAIKAAAPALKAHQGATSSVLLFSSVAVAQGFTAHASIAMAKGAVEGLTLALATELAPKIRINSNASSLTLTTLAAPLISPEQMANAIAGLHAMQRFGEPDDIASLGSYLLSSEASWMTGQIVGDDGGRSMLRTKG